MSKNKTRKIHRLPTEKPESPYESNNGMMTYIWGPATWHLLHCISFNYPVHPTPEDKKHYSAFVRNLQHVLPCGKCRKNLVKNFKKLPLEEKDMVSRESFSKYIFNLHEVINTMLGKKSGLTYEEVRDTYEQFRARCAPSHRKGKMIAGKPGNRTRREKGCTVPYSGKPKKCILKIVPRTMKCASFQT
jgi:hypothetical protein